MSLRSVVAAGAKITPPGWLPDNLCYETMMGSVAYGVSSDDSEMHYGDLSTAVIQPDEALIVLRKIADLTKRYR